MTEGQKIYTVRQTLDGLRRRLSMSNHEMRTCAKCRFFLLERNNVGECRNYEQMWKEGRTQGLTHRFTTGTCSGWARRRERNE